MQPIYETAAKLLQNWCQHHELPFPDTAIERTALYLDRLLHYQHQTNLTGFSSPEDIIRNLFIDSLQILRTRKIHGPLLDVGTGAGFPAIPIKIVCPEMEMILVEPRTKRYAFLRLIERELGLEHLQIYKAKIESAPVPDRLGTAISKALMPIHDWASLARPWARNGAKIACMISQADWQVFQRDLHSLDYAVSSIIEDGDRIYLLLEYDRNTAFR